MNESRKGKRYVVVSKWIQYLVTFSFNPQVPTPDQPGSDQWHDSNMIAVVQEIKKIHEKY